MDDSIAKRIADALERISPPPADAPDFNQAGAYVWHVSPDRLDPIHRVNRVALSLLIGIEGAKRALLQNTKQFAQGFPANNALLWGARGMGKSSLVKAVHASVASEHGSLKLVELLREDLSSLGRLLSLLKSQSERFVIFCDDFSFARDEQQYKSLKAVLDGGVEGRPANVLFYATSNRRHLMPRDMIENERSTAINPSESVDEKVSLSDRFGLWLGFQPCSQNEYLEMVEQYCLRYEIPAGADELSSGAIEWQQTRGARSGRVAWQYVTYLAGKHGVSISLG